MDFSGVTEGDAISFDDLGSVESGAVVINPPLGEEHMNADTFEEMLRLPEARNAVHEDLLPGNEDVVDYVLRGGKKGAKAKADGEQAPLPAGDRTSILEAQMKELVADRGRYGREVVGPMRDELAQLKAENQQLRQSRQSAPDTPASINPADYVQHFLGTEADPNDPDARRLASLGINILRASEQGANALIQPVLDKLTSLTEVLEATRAQAQASVPEDTMDRAREQFPELKALPAAQQYSFVKRLMNAAKSTDQNAPARRAAPSLRKVDPDMVVEGGSSYQAGDGSLRGQTDGALDRFRDLSDWRKPPLERRGGKAQQAVFLEMLQNGLFTG